jgi:hypothetical protein
MSPYSRYYRVFSGRTQMGKRGPKPRPDISKTSIFTVRLRPEERAALEELARRHKRTLSAEILWRLRRAIANDREIRKDFGNERNYALVQMAGRVMQRFEGTTGRDWMSSPYLFAQFRKSLDTILEAFAPEGDPEPPKTGNLLVDTILDQQGQMEGRKVILEVVLSDPESMSKGQLIKSDIKERLSKLIERPKMLDPITGEFRSFTEKEIKHAIAKGRKRRKS